MSVTTIHDYFTFQTRISIVLLAGNVQTRKSDRQFGIELSRPFEQPEAAKVVILSVRLMALT